MKFEVSEAADLDLQSAIRFYNSRPKRYGAAVKAEFTRAARAIRRNPRMYSLVEDGVPDREFREYFIGRFEQRVIYEVKSETVLIVAVVHASSSEGFWHRNLRTTP